MSRGLFIFIVLVLLVLGGGYLGVPYIRQKMVGQSLQTKINVLMAEDAFEVMYKNKSVSRTVVSFEVLFPLGSAAEVASELEVFGDDGKKLQVEGMSAPLRQDDFDKSLTKWTYKAAFFPIGFRRGMLRNKYRDLGHIWLPEVPLNVK